MVFFTRPRPLSAELYSPHKQSGVAIIIAMMFLALTFTLILQVVLLSKQESYQTYLIGQRSKMNADIFAVEQVAISLIKEDFRTDGSRGFESCAEDWAKEGLSFAGSDAFEGSTFTISIVDAQSLFNVNALVEPDANGDLVKIPFKIKALGSILTKALKNTDIQLPPEFEPDVLAEALGDWIDSDDDDESLENMEAETGDDYLPPNDVITTIDEIMVHPLFETQEARYVWQNQGIPQRLIALSPNEKVNINTASPDVLASISPLLTKAMVSEIEKKRPFSSIKQAFKRPVFRRLNSQQKKSLEDKMTVNSEYFILYSTLETEDNNSLRLRSLIKLVPQAGNSQEADAIIIERAFENFSTRPVLTCGK